MTEGQKPDDKAEIEGILADLESILSEKAPDEGKPRSEPGIANIVAGLGDALKQAQDQGTVPPSAAMPPLADPPKQQVPKPPAAKPPPQPQPPLEIKLDMPTRSPISHTPSVPPSAVPPPAQAHPTVPANPPPAQARPTVPANPPPAQPRPLSPHAPPPVVPPPQARPPAPANAPPPAAVPPAQARPPAPANPPSPASPSPAKPPVSANPPPAGSKPAVQPPQAVSPAAKPAPQQPPATSVPPALGTAPALAAIPPGALAEIPAEAPKDQIRRVSFLYSSGQKMPLVEFIKFVDSLALHFSKKPLYLRKVYLAELSPDNDLSTLADKIKAAGAVGVVGVLPGIHENKIRSLETGLAAAGISYYWLTPEEAFKRPVVLGLVVELMLLNAE